MDASETINIVTPDFETHTESELTCEAQTIRSHSHIYFKFGLGEIRIDAFLPTTYDAEISCLISFKALIQSNIFITYTENDIKNYLFSGYKTNIESNKRNWCTCYDNISDRCYYEINLPNIKLPTTKETLIQMAEICDKMHEEYILQETIINNILGTSLFPKSICPPNISYFP